MNLKVLNWLFKTRTSNPSVNSTTGCSRLALQTQYLDARKVNFAVIWGDSAGTSSERSAPDWITVCSLRKD